MPIDICISIDVFFYEPDNKSNHLPDVVLILDHHGHTVVSTASIHLLFDSGVPSAALYRFALPPLLRLVLHER